VHPIPIQPGRDGAAAAAAMGKPDKTHTLCLSSLQENIQNLYTNSASHG
jgi:hypothetical protein